MGCDFFWVGGHAVKRDARYYLHLELLLDAGPVPSPTTVLATLVVPNPDDTDDCRYEPADSRHESESNDGLPFSTLVAAAEGNVIPVEDISACAVEVLIGLLEHTISDKDSVWVTYVN